MIERIETYLSFIVRDIEAADASNVGCTNIQVHGYYNRVNKSVANVLCAKQNAKTHKRNSKTNEPAKSNRVDSTNAVASEVNGVAKAKQGTFKAVVTHVRDHVATKAEDAYVEKKEKDS